MSDTPWRKKGNRNMPPCGGCPDKKPGCQDHCKKPEYLAWKEEQFGHGETKATCLWLKGLPLLISTQVVEGREQRVWRMPPSAERAKLRSKTYPGIGRAMAEQWAGKEE